MHEELDVRHVTGPAGLCAVERDWQAIVGRMTAPRFFHRYEWYAAYLQALEPAPDRLHVFVAYRGGEPVAIFPLRLTRSRVGGVHLRTLEVPYDDHMSLGDVIYERSEENRGLLRSFVKYLRRRSGLRWDVMAVRALEDSAALYGAATGAAWLVQTVRVDACHYLAPAPYEETYGRLSKKFKASLRNTGNRLSRLGDVEYASERRRPGLQARFEDFLAAEASGWKGSGGTGTAIALAPRLSRFYRCLVEQFSAVDACEVLTLKAGGVCLAGALLLIVGGRCYFLKVGYNEEYAKLGPGQLLTRFIVEKRSGADRMEVNFVSGAEWTRRWQPRTLGVYSLYAFNGTPMGLAGAALLRARGAAKPAYRRIRGWVRPRDVGEERDPDE